MWDLSEGKKRKKNVFEGDKDGGVEGVQVCVCIGTGVKGLEGKEERVCKWVERSR